MKNFLNYSKNRILFFIFKLAVALFLAYLFSCFMTISPVYADSSVVCYQSDFAYSFATAKYSIPNSEETLLNAYNESYSEFLNSSVYSQSYVVTLKLGDLVNYDGYMYVSEFSFYFLPNPVLSFGFSGGNIGYSSSIISSKHFYSSYIFNSSSSSYYNYSSYASSTSKSFTPFQFNSSDACSANPTVFFTGTFSGKFTKLDDYDVLWPVYNVSDYTHQSISNTSIPYITDTWLTDISDINYKELSLDVSDFLVLYPKDYSEPFDATLFYKGSVCPTSVYEYGTVVNTNFSDRCSLDYEDFTRINFSVLQPDLDNHAVYYFKGYKKGASIKINSAIWDYKYIYYDDDPTLTIGDNTYNILNYSDSDLPNNSIVNENNNLAPGSSDNFFDTILDGIKAIFRSISSFFSDFFNKLISALSDLFVPPDGFMDDYITSMKDSVTNQLGILIYPFTFLEDIIYRIVNFHPTNGTIHIPEVQDPFYHVTLIEEQTINLYDIFTSGNLKSAYNIYLYVVDVYLIFGFLNLCYKKFYEFVCSNPGGGD